MHTAAKRLALDNFLLKCHLDWHHFLRRHDVLHRDTTGNCDYVLLALVVLLCSLPSGNECVREHGIPYWQTDGWCVNSRQGTKMISGTGFWRSKKPRLVTWV